MKSSLFQVVLLETVNICTRKCYFCKFGIEEEKEPLVELSMATIEFIASQLKTLNFKGRVSPFGVNEPLLDKRLPAIIKILSTTSAYLSIMSNGDSLTLSKIEELFDSGLDTIGLSLYEKSNREKFVELKAAFPKRSIWIKDMTQPENLLENRAGSFTTKRQPDVKLPCYRPSTMLSIKATGLANLCCADMFSQTIMGNANIDTLETSWYSSKFSAYREKLTKEREGVDPCQKCSYSGGAAKKYDA
jgi:MoaA/NifB/PqqE/SkfB family radical SAM enzyme